VPLNPKQARFVAEYLKDLNASASCLRAGYRTKNPNVVGPRLLAQVSIREAVDAALAKRAEKCELTAELVIGNMRRLAAKAEDAEDFSAAIKANETLGKHLKLWTDKVEHSGRVTLEEFVVGSMKRGVS
jgi:phage terminase small subunit